MVLPFVHQSLGIACTHHQPNRGSKPLFGTGQILRPHFFHVHVFVHHNEVVGQNGLALAHVRVFGRNVRQNIGDGIHIGMHMQSLGHFVIPLNDVVNAQRQARLRQPISQQYRQ